MPEGTIRIVSRPPGGAPDHIRDAWIGLILPATKYEGKLADVRNFSLIQNRVGGYEVAWQTAMDALGRTSPHARQWFEQNVHGFSALIFSPESCEVVPD